MSTALLVLLLRCCRQRQYADVERKRGWWVDQIIPLIHSYLCCGWCAKLTVGVSLLGTPESPSHTRGQAVTSLTVCQREVRRKRREVFRQKRKWNGRFPCLWQRLRQVQKERGILSLIQLLRERGRDEKEWYLTWYGCFWSLSKEGSAVPSAEADGLSSSVGSVGHKLFSQQQTPSLFHGQGERHTYPEIQLSSTSAIPSLFDFRKRRTWPLLMAPLDNSIKATSGFDSLLK